MRILLACDISTNGKGNPFTLQLLHALETHPDVTAVQHGTSWMKVPEAKFDVVHIHWPELLTNWAEPTPKEISDIQKVLTRWKQESAIVATVHNEYPHYRDTEAFRRLYRLVYTYTDGIIHMGEASKRVMRKRYADEMDRADEVVIPHGNYAYFPNEVSEESARLELDVPQDANVFLCFGSIRSMSEWKLIRNAFREANVPNPYFIIAANMPYRESRDSWRYWTVRVPIYCNPNMHREEGFIPPQRVQYYMNAADVTVIPRYDALNSGNVPLGMTFGNIVVGPDVGVIGEMLRATGNPTFDPLHSQTVFAALEEAVAKKNTALPYSNRIYAKDELNWVKTADRHVNHYKSKIKLT